MARQYGEGPKGASKPRKHLTDEELVAIVDDEFDSAMGKEGGDISVERAKSWDAYLSKPLGNEVDGQSKALTTDVSDVIDGIMPSLLRIFTQAENLAVFDPVGKDDIEAARQETDVVTHTFFKKNPAFMVLYTWMMDALIQKNGVVKSYWEDHESVTTEAYEGLNEQELQLLMDDEELEPQEQEERVEEMMVPTPTPMGVMPMRQQVTLYDVTFKRTAKEGKVCVDPVPPEEYRISSDAFTIDPCCARFVGHEREVTRSDAIEMGFDKDVVNDLPTSHEKRTGDERTSRRDKSEEDQDSPTTDESQEKILLREAYIKVDYDKDGVSELRQVFTSGGKLLGNEPCDRQPFHVLTPKPLPHKHFGRSVAELVEDIQELNTTLLRQALDNIYATNQPGHAVWELGMGEDTLDDLLTTAMGRVVRFSRPPSESYTPMTVPFTAQHSFTAIEYFDKAKRDRTGITQESEGLSPEALKNIQTTVLSQAIDVARGKVECIARIFAETGIKGLLLHIHELLLKHQNKPETLELRGEFVDIDPREWRKRTTMTVTVGLGLGTQTQNLIHLNAIWDKQKDIVAAGGMGTLVTPHNVYQTAAQIVKNANLKQPALFFTDPGPQVTGKEEDKPDPAIAVQMEAVKVEQQKVQLKGQKDQIEAQQKMMDMQQKQQELQAAHQREIEKLRQENEALKDKTFIEMEKIRNQLTDIELKYATNVPGSRV
jgi:hypothetical protein